MTTTEYEVRTAHLASVAVAAVFNGLVGVAVRWDAVRLC